MKKMVCVALAILAAAAILASAIIPAFAVNAEETSVSLLPATVDQFKTLSGGDGNITVTKNATSGYTFAADGGWPQAWYMAQDSDWATADVDDPSCVLKWDFEVVNGQANVLVFFAGQDPAFEAASGTHRSLNTVIDPTKVNPDGSIVDLDKGKYTGSIHVSELGCAEALMAGSRFALSGVKVFAVGGTVVVNEIAVVSGGEAVVDPTPGDDIEDTTEKLSLLPPSVNDFTKVPVNNTNIEVEQNEDSSFTFKAGAHWPNAWYMPAQEEWVTSNKNSGDKLVWDFEVLSGATNVVVYFAGQDPMTQAAKGAFVSINGLIDPSYVNADGDAIVDLPPARYVGEALVSELGCAEELIDGDGNILISGVKVFAVGVNDPAEVVVRELAIVTDGKGGNIDDGTQDEETPRDEVDGDYYGWSYDEWAEFRPSVYDYTNNVLFSLEAMPAEEKPEDICVTATIANYNREPIKEVSVEALIPEGYAIGGENTESLLKLDSVPYGGHATVDLYLVKTAKAPVDPDAPDDDTTTDPTKKPDSVKGNSPNTADVSQAMIAMIVALAAGAVVTVLCVKNHKARQVLSLTLVCVMALTAVATAMPSVANAQEVQGAEKVLTTEVTVGEETVQLTANGAYKAVPANGTDWEEADVSDLYHFTGTAWAKLTTISNGLLADDYTADVLSELQDALDAVNGALGLLYDHEDAPSITAQKDVTLIGEAEELRGMLEDLIASGADLSDKAVQDQIKTAVDLSIVVDNGAATIMDATYFAMSPALRDLDKALDGAKLVAYGDSLTAFGTWPLSVAKNCNMYLFNGATGGINTDEALARFDKYVANRDADFVTLCFGMNDLLMQVKNKPQVSLEDFKANMKLLCKKVEDLGATPILMTSSYLDESKFFTSQGQSSANYADVGGPLAWLDEYNAVTRAVAKEGGYHLVDIREACNEYTPAEFLDADGIHLGEVGNQVYADKISEYLLATFVTDPEAEKITSWFPYVASPAEPAVTDIISYDPINWDSPNPSEMTFAKDESGALLIANTNGKWPEAHYAADTSVLVPMEGSELVFDISTANVNTSILLFFNGATPFATTTGNWVVINPKLGGTIEPGSGDITANQDLKGSVKLTELGIPDTALDENGNLLVSGVKIFAAGAAGQNVTVRQLAISTTGAPV